MKNFIQPGEAIDLTVSADTLSGEVVIVGDLIGVASCTVKSGEVVAVNREGVYELPKKTGTAMAVGDKAYYNATDKEVTDDNADTLIGVVTEVAAAGDDVVRVLINA